MVSEWRNCKLGEIITLQRGFDLPNKNRRSGSIPIVSSSGISGYHDTVKAIGPGVVTGRYGTLGEVFYVKEDFWPLNTTLYVRDFKGNNPHFIGYFLRTLNLARHNCAGAVPGVNRNDLHLLSVKVPPFPTQRKIASILSAYDDLIENNTRRIKILEEMAQVLYHEWFVKFRFPGHEKVRMVESELGIVPEGWGWKKYSDILESTTGGDWGEENPTEKESSEVIVIRGTDFTDIRNGTELRSPKRYISSSSLEKRKLANGDIVVENSVNAKSRCVGQTILITQGILRRLSCDSIAASFCKVFRLKDKILAPMVYLHMKHLYATGDMAFYQNVATNGIGNFQTTRFVEREKILLPLNQKELENMSSFLKDITSSTLADKNANLRRTRDLLLPKLISGEVDVEKLDINIPTEVV